MMYYFSEQMADINDFWYNTSLIKSFNEHLGRVVLCLGVSCRKVSDNIEMTCSEVPNRNLRLTKGEEEFS